MKSAIDLFSGAGGATQGLKDAGFSVAGAVENDKWAAASYRRNHPEVKLLEDDIRKVGAHAWWKSLGLEDLHLLKACPPCQGFSSLASAEGQAAADRNDLVFQVVRLARVMLPRVVMVENVPGLQRDFRFQRMLEELAHMGYSTSHEVVCATRFGMPQRRKRLIMVAVREQRVELESLLPKHVPVQSVREAFAQRIEGPDALHVWRKLSPASLRRLSQIPSEGTRFDLPESEWLDCHRSLGGRHATSSYGRLKWDQEAPTMTTRCTTVSCGRFSHPVEDRGISLREAALLQAFPPDYVFKGSYGDIERQIGNAVPVGMVSMLVAALSEQLGWA